MAGEWKTALGLVREANDAPPGPERGAAVARARAFLDSAIDPHLRALARLLAPDAGEKEILCALVPLERADSRCRLSDQDLGISTADRAAPGPGAAAVRRDAFPLVVALDNVRAALNTGSIFRTCDFFGVESVALCGYTAGPESPQVSRAALGAELVVPSSRFGNVRDCVAEAKARGSFVVALETAAGALPPETVPLSFPAVVLLGSERFGLDPDVVASADAVCAIPGHGVKNSLNVGVAFAVAASVFRRRHEAGAFHRRTVP